MRRSSSGAPAATRAEASTSASRRRRRLAAAAPRPGRRRRRDDRARVLGRCEVGRRSRPIPTRAEAQRLRRQRRPVESGVTIVNLASGEKRDYPRIRRFAFSGEASTLDRAAALGPRSRRAAAVRRRAPAQAARRGRCGRRRCAPNAPRGTDLILRELAHGQRAQRRQRHRLRVHARRHAARARRSTRRTRSATACSSAT